MSSNGHFVPKPTPNFALIEHFCRWVIRPESCVEFRAFNANYYKRTNTIEKSEYSRTITGWYDRDDELAATVKRLSGVSGYVTVNPVHENFLFQKRNDVISATKDSCCHDKDILKFEYARIDIDPIRNPNDISATDSERTLAISRRDQILGDCSDISSRSLWGCTGNGAWILIHCDLPNTEQNRTKINRLIGSLAARYSDNLVTVDWQARNPSRHLPIPGTVKCKGQHTAERPWRLVTVDGGNLPRWREV